MLTNNQRKLMASLETKKGREKTGLCLVEGQKMIDTAGAAVEEVFHINDLGQRSFGKIATTDTPQEVIGVAKIPVWSMEQIKKAKTIILLDRVQDPGNVGAILRLCLGFDATMILVESADPSSTKVIRASAGGLFLVPWIDLDPSRARDALKELNRPIYRLEKRSGAKSESVLATDQPIVLIIGNEGSGISITSEGTSVVIDHNPKLESLNVATATAIALHERYR
jgi:TrmH family RNA methyltransferase